MEIKPLTDRNTHEQARFLFSVGKRIQQFMFSTFARLESEKEEGRGQELSLSQFKLLMTVRHGGETTVKDLAEKLGVSPPSVSVMVDKLVERNLLTRERSERDRRRVVIRVSPGESAYLNRIEEKMLRVFVQLVEDVGPETAKKWEEVLTRVDEVLDQRLQSKNQEGAGD